MNDRHAYTCETNLLSTSWDWTCDKLKLSYLEIYEIKLENERTKNNWGARYRSPLHEGGTRHRRSCGASSDGCHFCISEREWSQLLTFFCW